MDRTHEGKALRMLTIIDEFTKESLMIRVGRKIKSNEVIHALADLSLNPERTKWGRCTKIQLDRSSGAGQ
ncbi:MAG: hypothetical protein IH628_15945 [Proteobacteria bacterium]|nr:hypothetical protein [Pseudomonadota bacterium]